MKVERFIFGPFETNTFVVSNDRGEALLIDPACCYAHERQQLLNCLAPFGSPMAILATHGHLDHLWGAPWACEQWHQPVLMHEADVPMAKAMQQQYDLFGIRQTAKPFPVEALGKDQPILADMQIIHTPGHTPGSVCLYWEQEKVLLSGDTLFQMGYGRTDLPGGDYCQLIDSLEKLFSLPPDVHVYPGHGDDTTIAAERRF
ncbi:MAG: MBL fold metallo-hydrolase [Paludibacteraceae bacterium]|nr:MBL fold metallo-hydrolase [Paludibacteraceae bacterium]